MKLCTLISLKWPDRWGQPCIQHLAATSNLFSSDGTYNIGHLDYDYVLSPERAHRIVTQGTKKF